MSTVEAVGATRATMSYTSSMRFDMPTRPGMAAVTGALGSWERSLLAKAVSESADRGIVVVSSGALRAEHMTCDVSCPPALHSIVRVVLFGRVLTSKRGAFRSIHQCHTSRER